MENKEPMSFRDAVLCIIFFRTVLLFYAQRLLSVFSRISGNFCRYAVPRLGKHSCQTEMDVDNLYRFHTYAVYRQDICRAPLQQ